ncbi:MAG: FmdB family zinc ribbon protein [Actinomycetota bacterium]
MTSGLRAITGLAACQRGVFPVGNGRFTENGQRPVTPTLHYSLGVSSLQDLLTAMPLFEYVCRTCDHRFEALVSRSVVPTCPACRGAELSRQLSVFAVGSGGSRAAAPQPPGACGACGDPRGPGACKLD